MQRITERTGSALLKRLSKIIFLILLLSIQDCSKRDKRVDEGIGSILHIESFVFYKKFSSLVWEEAREGLPLFKGDYIRTGDKSSATLIIGGEKIIVNANTLIKIDKKIDDGSRDISVELVILNGDVSVESSSPPPKAFSVKRLENGKLVLEDISRMLTKREIAVKSLEDTEEIGREIELIYPCNNEVIGMNNPVFKWGERVNGTIRIQSDNGRDTEVVVDNEKDRSIELPYGNYSWAIYQENKRISNRCSFSIKGETESLKSINVVSRRNRQHSVNLSEKDEEPVIIKKKSAGEREDIVKKRLGQIQTIIDKSIEHIKDTKRSIDPEKIQNYAELYGKLDELTMLLKDLKVIQESLLIEVIKMDNPSIIVNYLNELEDIERNLSGIDREIKDIEEIIYKADVKAKK